MPLSVSAAAPAWKSVLWTPCGSVRTAKAFIAYADDCMTCYICERLCPSGAIFVHPFREELPPVFPDIPKALGGGL